jgi:nicotinamidase-related amidase
MNSRLYESLPIPAFFDPLKVGTVHQVQYNGLDDLARTWARRYSISPSAEDRLRIRMLLIDDQISFGIPGYELFIGGRTGVGAVEDNVRLCRFIYRYLGVITDFVITLDSHMWAHIFCKHFWCDAEGDFPSFFSAITAAEVEAGTWRVNPHVAKALGIPLGQLEAYALHYVRKLESQGKKVLVIWTYHVRRTSVGHALVPSVDEAIFFHSIARFSEATILTKGRGVSERYSPFEAEVADGPFVTIHQPDQPAIDALFAQDMNIIAGQSPSHCFGEAMYSIARRIEQTGDRRLADRFYLLRDCGTPVVTPVHDFTPEAEEMFETMAKLGMHIVESTTPMLEWPGVREKLARAGL